MMKFLGIDFIMLSFKDLVVTVGKIPCNCFMLEKADATSWLQVLLSSATVNRW